MEQIVKSDAGNSGSETNPEDSGDEENEDNLQEAYDFVFKETCKLVKKVNNLNATNNKLNTEIENF